MKGLSIFSIVFCLLISSCGNYKLVGSISRDGGFSDEHPWEYFDGMSALPSEIDRLAIVAAIENKKIISGNLVAVNVMKDKKYTYVAIYEDKKHAEEMFSPKKVMHYLVVSEKIFAIRGPTYEPFPDVSFERSVHICARKAFLEGGSSTLFVTGWVQPVMLKADVTSRCSVDVVAHRAELDGPGEMLCKKTINTCLPE